MSNMSYCRFQNTVLDLRDCRDHLDEVEDLSTDETNARLSLLGLCRCIAADYPPEPDSRPSYESCAADSVLLDEWEDHHPDDPPPEPINQATLDLLAEHARVLDNILAAYGAVFQNHLTAEYIHLLDRTIAHLMVEAPDLAKPLYKEITP